MPINLTGDLKYDTRGLPEGYDPHKLYEYRFERLLKDASGPEAFLYKYIPWSIIKSFAFAIDPTAAFKVAPGVISPVSRTRWSQTASLLQIRTQTVSEYKASAANLPNYHGISACWTPEPVYSTNATTTSVSGLQNQDPLPSICKDTTKRTRLMGSSQGELELFKSYLVSPPRIIRSRSELYTYFPGDIRPTDPCIVVGGTNSTRTIGIDNVTVTQGPYGAFLPISTYNAVKSEEIAFALSLAQTHAISMLKGYSPQNRDYTLFRNIAELKDLPGSILSLKESVRNLRQLYASLSNSGKLRKKIFDLSRTANDIPNEYLSYHFGWKQTYKDIMDLLLAPAKIAKRINFLIARAGKPTTFRSKRTFVSAYPGPPGFSYNLTAIEGDQLITHRLERNCELRLIVNATFDFPPVDLPYFRLNDYLDRVGITPRVTDVYNLIPWTWLVDWFTGFGNYVECIDNLNHDSSLINWGMIVSRTEGNLITDFQSRTLNHYSTKYKTDPAIVSDYYTYNRHQSRLVYSCEVRKDVASILNVKTTGDPSSLTAYQKSIIGALLAQRINFSRTHNFFAGS